MEKAGEDRRHPAELILAISSSQKNAGYGLRFVLRT